MRVRNGSGRARGWNERRDFGLHLEMEFLIKVNSVAQAIKTFTEFQQLMAEFTVETTFYFHQGMAMCESECSGFLLESKTMLKRG